MAKKPQQYLLHILGSLLFISIPILSSPDLNSHTSLISINPFRREFLSYLLLLGFFYFNYLYLIPQYYFARKYWWFFICVIGCFSIIAFLPSLIMPGNMPFLSMKDGMPGSPPDGVPNMMRWRSHGWHRRFLLPPMIGGAMLQFLLVFSLSFLLRVNRRIADIQSEKLKTEVSYLRAQINPHFLFNTLNSLYALALEKSDAAPEAILKLSSMMRYVVTESGRDRVALESEMAYLKNYISLQRLRMDDDMDFTFIISGDTAGKYISPMLLIPFVENAFKYGLNPEEEAAIDINIEIAANEMKLNVKNKKVNVVVPPEEESGHGIENTRLRLQYLYPDLHTFTIIDKEEYFEVQLKLTLV
ncbi:MAG: histidine kinase [Bacteroidota bacterium]